MQQTFSIKALFVKLSKLCAYTHIYRLLVMLFNGHELSEKTKIGRNIALLGFFCPFFWISLFTGAETATTIFHAIHSSIVFLLGVVIMVFSLKQKKTYE